MNDIAQQLPFINHSTSGNFFLIAGPCVIENEKMPLEIASFIQKISDKLKIPFIFKASYRKANRSSLHSFTGIGDEKGLDLLAEIKNKLHLPVLTDIHTETDAALAAKYVDVLQIPAFLCRQTDLLLAAAKTEKPVNVKKGQFVSPEAMQFAVEKIRSAGNNNVMITERGTTFGYQDLIVDFCGIEAMKKNKCPVILDVTHSLQKPNQASGTTGGKRTLIETLAKAGIAAGFDGIFIETHPHPEEALSDKTTMLPLNQLEELLIKLLKIHKAVNNF